MASNSRFPKRSTPPIFDDIDDHAQREDHVELGPPLPGSFETDSLDRGRINDEPERHPVPRRTSAPASTTTMTSIPRRVHKHRRIACMRKTASSTRACCWYPHRDGGMTMCSHSSPQHGEPTDRNQGAWQPRIRSPNYCSARERSELEDLERAEFGSQRSEGDLGCSPFSVLATVFVLLG
ncbi:hypothetical protein BJ912DRAFT_1149330 [Pholiota molesta]|nr:hypothetical protein BJ912DRAFT_1149330 [Pholiota molesta]